MLVRMEAVVGFTLSVLLGDAAETSVSKVSASEWARAFVNSGMIRSLLASLATSNITNMTLKPIASSREKPGLPTASNTKFTAVRMTVRAAASVAAAASRGARGSWTTMNA